MVLSKHLHRLRADQRGTVSVIMGLLIVPLVGALGIGFEVSNWYMTGRFMQNAADAAALAAATNGGANYDVEAKAVAAQYGFVDGANNIAVAASNTAACPGGGNTCYSVTIAGAAPLLVSQIVGYQGDTTLNGGNIMSNTAAKCDGSNLGAGLGLAHGTSNGCGVKSVSGVDVVTDPYSGLASNIPPLSSSGCAGNYPQETRHGNAYSVATSNQLSGALNLSSGNNFKCGDQMLAADVVINTPPGTPAVLVIENGQLDLNGHALTTADGS